MLLLLNLAAVAYLITRPGDEPAAAPVEQAAVRETPVDQSPAAAESMTRAPPAEGRAALPPATADREPAVSVEAAPPAAREMAEPEPERLPAVTATTETVSAPPPRPTVTDGLPTFNELRAQGQLQLPDLHIDIHVYSGNPADRFVFVNMSKYREKERLTEGPVLEEITPDGVVLDYVGKTFLLPRE